jgi:hypothetical protein
MRTDCVDPLRRMAHERRPRKLRPVAKRAPTKRRSTAAPHVAHRLVPELVPKPLWGKSAKNTLGPTAWKQIRQDVLAAAEHACEMCGEQPNVYYGDLLNCHGVTTTGVVLRLSPGFGCSGACDNAVHIEDSIFSLIFAIPVLFQF